MVGVSVRTARATPSTAARSFTTLPKVGTYLGTGTGIISFFNKKVCNIRNQRFSINLEVPVVANFLLPGRYRTGIPQSNVFHVPYLR